jgi:hypothetical protein
MSEILLCVKNRNVLLAGAPKQGDVVAVCPDGWEWSTAELGVPVEGNPNGNHNFFRIVKLPNVTVAQASTLLPPEQDVDPENPSPYLQYRAKYLDKSKISPVTMQALLDNWNDDGREQGFITLNYTAAQINSIVSTRAPIAF